jgi:hypothetical protein
MASWLKSIEKRRGGGRVSRCVKKREVKKPKIKRPQGNEGVTTIDKDYDG